MQYAAFLRAVNVAKTQISMSSLKVLFTALGFDDPHALIQSGNIIFGARKQNTAALESLLERETQQRLKVSTVYFIRDANELAQIIEKNPFPRESRDDPGRLVVFLLKDAADAKAVTQLQARVTGPEIIRASGRNLYITYPNGQGKSKLTNAVIEKALRTRGTARNWNTVLKMAAAMEVNPS
jgi:uncharacterized protein (DUF1697 family)